MNNLTLERNTMSGARYGQYTPPGDRMRHEASDDSRHRPDPLQHEGEQLLQHDAS